ncbi:LysR substrate-binding domain-containing protein [Mesorhizobium sp. M0028]|uniref:LysR substrate-binding domain-containing protein n=1 Tax=Mesorhizobium sp. M0028 TaxID=2956849 RepID=UPI00333A7B9B
MIYLQAFEAAGRHLSFTEAAVELNCTQAAISQRIRALEQFFARPLFHRLPSGLKLTAVGEAYLPGVIEALDLAEAATQGIYGRPVPRTVTLSAPLSFVVLCLSARLPRFKAQNPDTELRLNSTIWTDPNVELADLNIQVVETVRTDKSMRRLTRDRMTMVCSPSLLHGKTPEQVLAEATPLVIQGKHQLWDRWAKAKNFCASSTQLKVDNAVCALELAAQGVGITVTFTDYCQPYLDSGRLVAPFGPAEKLSLCHVLRVQSSNLRSPAQRFHDWLLQEFAVESS